MTSQLLKSAADKYFSEALPWSKTKHIPCDREETLEFHLDEMKSIIILTKALAKAADNVNYISVGGF